MYITQLFEELKLINCKMEKKSLKRNQKIMVCMAPKYLFC